MKSDAFGGNVGLAITQAISLTGMVHFGVKISGDLENQMTSVERVLDYTTIPKESALESSSGKNFDIFLDKLIIKKHYFLCYLVKFIFRQSTSKRMASKRTNHIQKFLFSL